MSPVSLLFSSDGESLPQLVQALRELELEVEPCPDIFTAVEWLTSRSFDLIVADWDSGPEAAFLLQNARELKLNRAAFTLALASGASNLATGEDSPDLVLIKPLIPDKVKYALLTNDRFLSCLKAWIARGDFAHADSTSAAMNEGRQPRLETPSHALLPACPAEPSPIPRREVNPGLNLTFASLDRRLFRSMRHHRHTRQANGQSTKPSHHGVLWGSGLIVAFVSAGYIFGQPLQVQSVFASMATACKQVIETKFSRQESEPTPSPEIAAVTPVARSQVPGRRRYQAPSMNPLPVPAALPDDQTPDPATETLAGDAHIDQSGRQVARVEIPESLQTPPPDPAAAKTTSLRRSPSLLSQVEPVTLSENLSQELLLDKVQPSYPEQALKAGLQGVVVLQAFIGRDGSIRDLKLVGGSLLLGQAAVQAVRQWRYKPYLRNGVAVEAETYVTVNFKLP